MLGKIFNKHSSDSQNESAKSKALIDLNPQIIAHYGIPPTASRLAYDPIQQLLAIGTLYLGDDCGLISVLQYDIEEREILRQQYSIPVQSVSEAAGIPLRNDHSVVGILPQPCFGGNRLLFAYDNGVIVLWDISEDQLVFARGWNSHQANDEHVVNLADIGDEQVDKEIISLCWASSDGSILAVGYVDGDILLWDLSSVATRKDHKAGKPVYNVVKLQLSSSERRFPVITLHWSVRGVPNDDGGQLFVYGGDEIGSAEVLTILSLEWSPKKDALKNVVRANVTLQGSFADMILIQNYGVVEHTGTTSFFLLTSPGQLQYYDSHCLLELLSDQDKTCTTPFNYRSVVPTSEPYLTVGRFISVLGNIKCSAALSEMASDPALQETYLPSDKNSKWPLNGGVPCHLSLHGERKVERLYIAGYQDGSVRIWDATYPILSPIFIFDLEVRGITNAGVKGSVSALDFSSETLNIATGDDCGTVYLHHLIRDCNKTRHITKTEVHDFEQDKESHVSAVFTLCTSPVCNFRYTNLGSRLAVGYKSGKVAMLNISSPSVLFLIDTPSSPNSHVVSFSPAISLGNHGLTTSLDHSKAHGISDPAKELICALTNDFHIAVLDSSDGNVVGSASKNLNTESTAISMYILGKYYSRFWHLSFSLNIVAYVNTYCNIVFVEGINCITGVSGGEHLHFLSQEDQEKTDPAQVGGHSDGDLDKVDQSTDSVQTSTDLQILVCCKNALLLYSLKSVIQGHVDSIHEVHLQKTSCWTTTFKKDNEYRLLVFYQTGTIEIRIPQSLPCLYDEALTAALDLNFSPNQKKNKETSSGIFGGLMKGLRESKEAQNKDPVEGSKSLLSVIDNVFSSSKTDASAAAKDARKVVELNIDDIEIDEPLHVSPIAHKSGSENKDKSTEKQKLFEGGTSETKPRQRTIEEIKAKYRKPENATSATASAASEAKNKLLERQEKLERIGLNSEELRNNAENFSSMAKELAKKMESRKWWQL
uniref:V-SNARE coiled-coil homology domain-containing protein n=1 Tax=Chenopodium quinoa TaxID=63459 RepID=A0A803M3U7_CHEQI